MPQAASLFTDVESHVVGTSAVVIYSPAGKKRTRFPEGVVEVFGSEEEALAHADPVDEPGGLLERAVLAVAEVEDERILAALGRRHDIALDQATRAASKRWMRSRAGRPAARVNVNGAGWIPREAP